jgi:hypothetical protein
MVEVTEVVVVVVVAAAAIVVAHHRLIIVDDAMNGHGLVHTLLVSIFYSQDNFVKPCLFHVFFIQAFVI